MSVVCSKLLILICRIHQNYSVVSFSSSRINTSSIRSSGSGGGAAGLQTDLETKRQRSHLFPHKRRFRLLFAPRCCRRRSLLVLVSCTFFDFTSFRSAIKLDHQTALSPAFSHGMHQILPANPRRLHFCLSFPSSQFSAVPHKLVCVYVFGNVSSTFLVRTDCLPVIPT